MNPCKRGLSLTPVPSIRPSRQPCIVQKSVQKKMLHHYNGMVSELEWHWQEAMQSLTNFAVSSNKQCLKFVEISRWRFSNSFLAANWRAGINLPNSVILTPPLTLISAHWVASWGWKTKNVRMSRSDCNPNGSMDLRNPLPRTSPTEQRLPLSWRPTLSPGRRQQQCCWQWHAVM